MNLRSTQPNCWSFVLGILVGVGTASSARAANVVPSIGFGLGGNSNGDVSPRPIPTVGGKIHGDVAVEAAHFVGGSRLEYQMGIGPDDLSMALFAGAIGRSGGSGFSGRVLIEGGARLITDLADDFFQDSRDANSGLIPFVGTRLIGDHDLGSSGGWSLRVDLAYRRDLTTKHVVAGVEAFSPHDETFTVGGGTVSMAWLFCYAFGSGRANGLTAARQ